MALGSLVPHDRVGTMATRSALLLAPVAVACTAAYGPVARADSPPQRRRDRLVQELALEEPYYTQDRLEVQWSLDGDFAHGPGFARDEGTLSLELGVTDRLELDGSVPYSRQVQGDERGYGVGSPEAGFHYNLVRTRAWGLTTGASVTFPSIAENAHDPVHAYRVTLIGFRDLRPVYVNAQTSLTLTRDEPGAPLTVHPSGAVALFGRFGKVLPILEVGAFDEPDGLAFRVSPELAYRPSEHLEIGGAFVGGVVDGDLRYGAFAHLTVEVELGREPGASGKELSSR